MAELKKFCRGCSKELPYSDFGKGSDTACGLKSRCRKCRNTQNREWSRNNLEKEAARHKRCRDANPEKEAARQKRWYASNKSKVNFYQKKRYHEDPGYRIKRLLRNRMYYAIDGKKVGSAVKDLGCSLDDFQLYLEAKFTLEMSFDNHGSYWELDHIKSLADFDLTDREQFLAACHYTNLQPLTIAEHKKKTKLEALQCKSIVSNALFR